MSSPGSTYRLSTALTRSYLIIFEIICQLASEFGGPVLSILGQMLAEDQEVISRRIEIVDDRLTGITATFVKPARRSISRGSGRFYQQQVASLGLYLGFHPTQQSAPNTTSLSRGVHCDPIQVEAALSERMGAEAGITKHPVLIAIHQKGISTGFPLILICVPEFFDAALLCWVEGTDPGRQLQN
jgi:hypothetical protein